MSEERERRIFSEADHLLLLQLMTRRAIAEHRISTDRNVEESTSVGVDEPPARPPIPPRWRLLAQDVSLYKWQRECLPLWLARGRGTVKVATGGGKTMFALAAAQQLQNEKQPDLRLVVVVPTVPLMYQWRDELRQGNLPGSCVGLMGGGQELPPPDGIRVLICVLASARDKLPELVRRADWAERMLLVVDECHRANAEQARRIFEANPRYTLGLSATPEQETEAEGPFSDKAYSSSPVGQALGPIFCSFSIKDSLAAGLLTPFEIWHIGLPLTSPEDREHRRLSREIADLRKQLQIRHRRSRSRLSFIPWCQAQASRSGPAASDAERFIGLASRRKRLLYSAAARSKVALEVLEESVADSDTRIIVFHESINEIEDLFLQALARRLPAVLEHSRLPGSLRDDSIEGFRMGTARIIISAKSLIEGFNVPSADLGLIAASTGSVRQRIQSLGRMLRRKPDGRTARIVVLYIADTEDEAIYTKADWADIVGAQRNRYFLAGIPGEGQRWLDMLHETSEPPRSYRPPSWEVEDLRPGDHYPARDDGQDLKVDQDNNLRTETGEIVPVPRTFIETILAQNQYRRAHITAAGHIIVRSGDTESRDPDWRFVGVSRRPAEGPSTTVEPLMLKTLSGRRVIARRTRSGKGALSFALGPGKTRDPDAGPARDRLLEWIQTQQERIGRSVKKLYWDGGTCYWLEIGGDRIEFPGPLPPLEFKNDSAHISTGH